MESSASVPGWLVTVVSTEVISVMGEVVVVTGVLEEEVEELVKEKVEVVEEVVEVEEVVVVVVVDKRPTVKERLSLSPEPLLPIRTYSSISQVHRPASLASKPDISMPHS